MPEPNHEERNGRQAGAIQAETARGGSLERSYEIIVGLEIHVQLRTASKLFCDSSTHFGAAPNTQTCPICLGMPGVLPVMNREALMLAVKTAVAMNCEISEFTKWDRKNYYYPDLPKGYQISQYDMPFCTGGYLDVADPKDPEQGRRIHLVRIHLEEDAGKSMHDEASGTSDSRIDLNRTGTPLMEIVTQPDIRSPEEAKLFLEELKLLLTYLDVSDCNMQEGSLRVDANINLHIDTGTERIPTPIVEVKNMNSFRAVERALAYEAQRQLDVWQETGSRLGDVPKQTRGWDESAQVTRGQRSKEEASDYRYFPEPDLVPVEFAPEQVQRVQESLGELPADLRARLAATYEILPYDAHVLVNQGQPLVDYYVDVAEACGEGKLASNWIQQDVLRWLKEHEATIEQFPLSSKMLAEMLKRVQSGELPSSRARDVFLTMVESKTGVDAAMQELGIEQVDESELTALCEKLLDANPNIVADIQGGKTKAVGALIGQAKKQNPNADPSQVRKICLELAQKR